MTSCVVVVTYLIVALALLAPAAHGDAIPLQPLTCVRVDAVIWQSSDNMTSPPYAEDKDCPGPSLAQFNNWTAGVEVLGNEIIHDHDFGGPGSTRPFFQTVGTVSFTAEQKGAILRIAPTLGQDDTAVNPWNARLWVYDETDDEQQAAFFSGDAIQPSDIPFDENDPEVQEVDVPLAAGHTYTVRSWLKFSASGNENVAQATSFTVELLAVPEPGGGAAVVLLALATIRLLRVLGARRE